METVDVKIKNDPYPIYVDRDVLSQFADILKLHYPARQIALITSKRINGLYGKQLKSGFDKNQKVLTLIVPEGEKAKSHEQVQYLYTQLLENRIERSALIVGFGGGVVGDLAGFVAATYLRGVRFVQAPTTLLSQVDSSIGGKVGINHPMGKNLIGAFKQPLFVFADVATLKTLAGAEIRCGLGEVIKYAFILNPRLFEYLEQHLEKALEKDEDTLYHLVKVSAAEKAAVVEKDEKEQNLRMILNFGHTFGHALEAEYQFASLKHGEAVILGMKCALFYAVNKNYISQDDYQRGVNLLRRVPVALDKAMFNEQRLLERMTLDKKVQNDRIRLILLEKIGKHRIESEAETELLKKSLRILVEKS